MEVATITVRVRREAQGLDGYVPVILRSGALYDPDLDRFFLALPLAGVRSRHSLRVYAYDVVVWLRFLEAGGKTVWSATPEDIEAYHRIRRRSDPADRIKAATWNRAIAALVRLYSWGQQHGLISQMPFTQLAVSSNSRAGRRGLIGGRNAAYERTARRSEVRCLTMADYRAFREIGLRMNNPDGTERAGARDRNGLRNTLFADLLVSTGLRLEEASGLIATEVSAIVQDDRSRQFWLRLPPPLTKGDSGRSVLISRKLLGRIATYVAVERAQAVAKFQDRRGYERIDRPIMVQRPALARMLDICTPDERSRLVLCDDDGTPREPAALWLTEVGQPVRPNSWEIIFTRACQRCVANGFPLSVSPHHLRHTFAVHMLALLIQQRLQEAPVPASSMESYRLILGDPLQHVQRLLGHASLSTTYIYLDHVISRSDTVETAVEDLLALLPGGLEP